MCDYRIANQKIVKDCTLIFMAYVEKMTTISLLTNM